MKIIPEIVYALCMITSILCTTLLFKAYLRSRMRLLLWSAFCFAGFALNNLLVFVDLVLVPQMDLSSYRIVPALIGLAVLIYGLITEVSA